MSLTQEIDRDLQRAPANRVVYLEGRSDVPIFFALIGRIQPPDDVVDGVLVRGLRDGPSGSSAVVARVDAARNTGRRHVYGFVDGDGRDLHDLTASFDGPGPLFSWRGYNIESLLVRAGWPTAWGSGPDWPAVMRTYSALVALNRVGVRVRDGLRGTQLYNYVRPSVTVPLHDRATVRASLVGARQILDRDLAAEFDELADRFEALVDTDVDAAHAWLDGKWLVHHHVEGVLGRRQRDEWTAAVVALGGLPEVGRKWATIRP